MGSKKSKLADDNDVSGMGARENTGTSGTRGRGGGSGGAGVRDRRRPSTSSQMPGEKRINDTIGNNFVTFSTIGFCLYLLSTVIGVNFEKFLFVLLLAGFGLIASAPGFNLHFSEKYLSSGLNEEQKNVIRSFVMSRTELNTGDQEEQKKAIATMRQLSYSSFSNFQS